MKRTPSPLELDRVRKWLRDWELLRHPACMRREWIMLKLSCTETKARRLIEAAEGDTDR